jgi:hypothetical protein
MRHEIAKRCFVLQYFCEQAAISFDGMGLALALFLMLDLYQCFDITLLNNFSFSARGVCFRFVRVRNWGCNLLGV